MRPPPFRWRLTPFTRVPMHLYFRLTSLDRSSDLTYALSHVTVNLSNLLGLKQVFFCGWRVKSSKVKRVLILPHQLAFWPPWLAHSCWQSLQVTHSFAVPSSHPLELEAQPEQEVGLVAEPICRMKWTQYRSSSLLRKIEAVELKIIFLK